MRINDSMHHDAGQAGFAVFEGPDGAEGWLLNGEGSFVLVTAGNDPRLGDKPEGAFKITVYFEIPDQNMAWVSVVVLGFRKALLYGRQVLTVRSTGASMWECRRVLYATPDSTEQRDEGIDTNASLINDITNWREAYGLKWDGVSALQADLANGGFAMLTEPGLSPEHIAWLTRWLSRWELVSAEGRA